MNLQRLLFSLLFFVSLTTTAYSQSATFSMPATSGCSGETVCVPITVRDFSDVVEFGFSIVWDEEDLTFLNIQNVNPIINGAMAIDINTAFAGAGLITSTWQLWAENSTCEDLGAGLTIDDDEVLFEMCFQVLGEIGEQETISFFNAPQPLMVNKKLANGDCTEDAVLGTVNGTIAVCVDPLQMAVNVPQGAFQPGDQICVDVVMESGFINLQGLQFGLQWDTDILQVVSVIPNSDIPNNFPVVYNISDPNEFLAVWSIGFDAEPVTLDPNTVFAQVCFEITGDCGDNTTVSIGTGPLGQPVEATNNNLQLIPTVLTNDRVRINTCNPFGLDVIFSCPPPANLGDIVCVEVQAGDNFENITIMEYLITCNPQIAQFVNVQNFAAGMGFNVGDFDDSAVGNGILGVEYNSSPFGPQTLSPGDVVFEVCYEIIGVGSSTFIIGSSPSDIQTVPDAGLIGINPTNCEIEVIQPESVVLSFENADISSNSPVCIPITADGVTDIEQMTFAVQFDDALFEYTGFQSMAIPGATINDGLATSGVIIYEYDDIPVDLVNGTVLFEICLQALTDAPPGDCAIIDVIDAPFPVPAQAYTSENPDVNVGIVSVPASTCVLFPEGFGLNIGDAAEAFIDSTVCVPVSVISYDNILSGTFDINFDPTKLEYVNIVPVPGVPLQSINTDDINLGIIHIELGDGVTPVALMDDMIIFEVCFNTLMMPGCTEIFGTAPSEPSSQTTNGDGSILFTDGEICIEDRLKLDNLTVTPTQCSDACNGRLEFEVSGGDGDIFVRLEEPFRIADDLSLEGVCAGWAVFTIFNNGSPSLSLRDSVFVTFDESQEPVASAGDDRTLGCPPAGFVAISGVGNQGETYCFYREVGENLSQIECGDLAADGSFTQGVTENGTYILEVINAFGCSSFDTVVVNPPTLPIAEAGPVDTALTCTNETIVLTGEGSSTDGLFTYMWEQIVAGNPVDTLSNLQSVTITMPGRYRLTVINSQTFCESTDEIIVNDLREFPNLILPTQTSLACDGGPASLDAGPSGPEFTYSWFEIAAPGTELSDEQVFDATVPGIYIVDVTNTNNACSSTDTVEVVASTGNPEVMIPEVSLYCSSDSTLIPAIYTNVSPSANYIWTTTGGDIAVGQFNMAQPIVLAEGTYMVEVTDAGCVGTGMVIVGPSVLPQVDAGAPLELACNNPTLITATGDEGADFDYQWYFEGDSIMDATSLTVFAQGLGTHSIQITNNVTGCSSIDSMEIVASSEFPEVILPDTAGILTCAVDSIILDATVVPANGNYSFSWSGGPGEQQADGSFIARAGGTYTVEVTNDDSGCSNTASTFVDASFAEPPFAALTRDTISLTCEQPTRILDASLSSSGDTITYFWENVVAGEMPNEQGNDTLIVGTAGTYVVTVINLVTQCSATDTVVVRDTRVFPVADTMAVTPITCDNPMTTIGLNLEGDPNDFTVQWFCGADCENPPNGQTTTVTEGGNYNWVVINNITGCFLSGNIFVESENDSTATVEFIEPAPFDCTTSSVTLEAVFSGGTPDVITWTSLEGNTITPATGSLIVSVDGPGFYVVDIEAVGTCGITDTVFVAADQNTPVADAGMDFSVICGEMPSLDGSGSTQGAEFTLLWTSVSGTILSDPTLAMPMVDGPGTYVLEVTNTTNLCSDIDTVVVGLEEIPADGGIDQSICGDSTSVTGNLPPGTTGLWTGVALNGSTLSTNGTEATITGITSEAVVLWTLSAPGCPDYSSDTVTISVSTAPVAFDDNLLVDGEDGIGTIDVATNDQRNGPYTVTFLNEPEFGTITSDINGRITYQAPAGISGQFTIDYEICSSVCDGLCDQATLTIRVEADGTDAPIYNAITPNEDGLNDRFVFEILEFNAEDYPDNEIIIFNRWGDIVYEAKPYLNDFNGTLSDGSQLPEGTYYYILRLDLGEGLIFRGDLTIVR
ncbi:MAG: gliding motility-associated C-terminal domain-containing protein [Bacteroidota bacterium]